MTGAIAFTYALKIVLRNIRVYDKSNSNEVNLIFFPSSGISQRPKNTLLEEYSSDLVANQNDVSLNYRQLLGEKISTK